MTVYLVEYTPAASRQISKLKKTVQARLKSKIATLSENPRPHGCKKLKGFENNYRIRIGDYRDEVLGKWVINFYYNKLRELCIN
jgi:mRNA interferase RelE/StbE